MPSWWGKSSKDLKKKSNGGESLIASMHMMKCMRPGVPRKQHNDSTFEKESQPLPLPSSRFTCHDNSGNTALNEPSPDGGAPKTSPSPRLPKTGQVKKIKSLGAVVGEGDVATLSNSSDTFSDTDDPYDTHLVSPQASDFGDEIRSNTTSPGFKQTGQFSFVDKNNSGEMSKPPKKRSVNGPDSLRSSPSRSPMRGFVHEPVANSGLLLGSGRCSSPGSLHNSITGDMPCQLFWPPQNRCSPECSPLTSPRMMSPGPSSRIQSGRVTPLHHRAGLPVAESPTAQSDDGRKQSHPLPLPPLKIGNPCTFTPYSAGVSPRITRSPGRTDYPPSPSSSWKKGKLLGRGTFGEVYLGFNSESGEMCAMKEVMLFSDDAKSRESAKQLRQEIALLSRLRHPNIVQYYGSEMVDDKLYIYLEYVSGGSIHKILQEYGQLGEAAIRSYTQQILSGLSYLHAKNTVHRDIKGANILVDPNGRVKLADFGMAKHITGQSCPLSFKGSPYWMAPEVITNSSRCNLAVDIWSLGCTVLEMATTKPPWSQYEGVAAMFKVGNSKELPELPDHLSDDGKDFVMKCLQRNPSYRLTAAQLLEHPFVKNQCSSERPVPADESLESVPAIARAVKALGFGRSGSSRCLDSSGSVNHSKSPKTRPGFSDRCMVRNISCPLSPSGNPLSHSPPPQHIQGRLSPPVSSPRASTPPGGGNDGSIPMSQNYSHKTNIFGGVFQKAHSSVGTLWRESDYSLGNQVERTVSRKEQLYDAHLAMSDRVSQQLLGSPIRRKPGLVLRPNSTMPSRKSEFC